MIVSCCYFLVGLINSLYAILIVRAVIGTKNMNNQIFNKFIISLIICNENMCCNHDFLFVGVFKHGQVLLRTIVTDQVPLEKQTQLFGQLKSVAGISFTLGPAIGGHLTEFENGFTYICCCAGILLAINIGS